MFKKILVPTDGSKGAEKALKMAIDLAGRFESRLLILHVAEITYSWGAAFDTWGWSITLYEHMMEELHERANRILDEAKQLALKSGASVETRFEIGSPVATICKVAEKEKCDLIVMGNRGLSDFKGLFLGSVSHGVLQRSLSPVMLVKDLSAAAKEEARADAESALL